MELPQDRVTDAIAVYNRHREVCEVCADRTWILCETQARNLDAVAVAAEEIGMTV